MSEKKEGEKIRFVNYENFLLKKLTYNEKQQLLVIDWEEKTGTKDGHQDKPKDVPHPDLLAALDALKPHLSRTLGLQQGWDFARENVKENGDALKQAMAGAKSADNSVKVIGIVMMGEGETEGVKINGFMQCLNGQMKVNCPVIRFGSDAMAIEKTVEGLIEKVKIEAYGFLHQNKRKQYSIEEQEEIDRKKLKKRGISKNQMSILDGEQQDAAKEIEATAEADLN